MKKFEVSEQENWSSKRSDVFCGVASYGKKSIREVMINFFAKLDLSTEYKSNEGDTYLYAEIYFEKVVFINSV